MDTMNDSKKEELWPLGLAGARFRMFCPGEVWLGDPEPNRVEEAAKQVFRRLGAKIHGKQRTNSSGDYAN